MCTFEAYLCTYDAGLYTVQDVHGMMEEILKMKDFDHPNVMSLLGICLNSGPGVAYVMPFMENGSLLSYLRKDREVIVLQSSADAHTVECCSFIIITHFMVKVRSLCTSYNRTSEW